MPSYLEISEEIAREAGALLHGYFERHIGFELKGEFDLVTEADRASEKLVIERLRKHFPTHSIVAEESGGHAGESAEYCWYVDPLDGTTNFAHGFPMYNVTLALEKAGEIDRGSDLRSRAQRNVRLRAGIGRAVERPADSRFARAATSTTRWSPPDFPAASGMQNVNVHFYYQLAMITHGVRRAGAAALDLAYVASGRLDAFWEFGLNPWDMAAGILLVTEAGGKCSDMHGAPARLRGPHLLADNGTVHEGMLEVFSEVFRREYRYAMPVIE